MAMLVESGDKPVFVYLQRTVISGILSLLKRLKTHLEVNYEYDNQGLHSLFYNDFIQYIL